MLVITRTTFDGKNQFSVGDDVTITILRVTKNQVKIGIDAPRDKRILRCELDKTGE